MLLAVAIRRGSCRRSMECDDSSRPLVKKVCVEISGSSERSGLRGPYLSSPVFSPESSVAGDSFPSIFSLTAATSAGARGSSSAGSLLATLAMRKSNKDMPKIVIPPTERFGSSSGRRTIMESISIRTKKRPPMTKSQI